MGADFTRPKPTGLGPNGPPTGPISIGPGPTGPTRLGPGPTGPGPTGPRPTGPISIGPGPTGAVRTGAGRTGSRSSGCAAAGAAAIVITSAKTYLLFMCSIPAGRRSRDAINDGLVCPRSQLTDVLRRWLASRQER